MLAIAYNGTILRQRCTLMAKRVLAAAIPAALVGTFGLQGASADIYTWVDAKGTINVSNVAPPTDVRITNVTRDGTPTRAAPSEAAAEAARIAEVQALAERVRQLEQEVETARRQAEEWDYRAASPLAPMPYVAIGTPPPVVQYQVVQSPPASAGCDAGWAGCAPWGWGPVVYPTTVILLHAPSFHRHRLPHGGTLPPSFGPVRPLTGFPRG